MPENSSISSSEPNRKARHSVYCLILFALITGLMEPWLYGFARTYYTDDTFLLCHWLKERVGLESVSADIVFIGDSTLRSAVNPAVVEKHSGHAAINLGTVASSGLMDDYYLLRSYVVKHGAPKAVVMMHGFPAWDKNLQRDLYNLYYSSPAETAVLLNESQLGLMEAADSLAQNCLLSYRYKPYLRSAMSHAAKGDFDFYAVATRHNKNFLQAREQLGYYPDEGKFTLAEDRVIERYRHYLNETAFRISGANSYFMKKILALAGEYGFGVYYAHSPLYKKCMVSDDPKLLVTGLQKYLEETARESGHFHMLYKNIPIAGRDDLGSFVNHLNARGAAEFSAFLAAQLKMNLQD
ncbi:hypothetical protein ACFL54_06385 [Planctomycetota bacterium]